MSRNFSNWLQAYLEYTEVGESPTSFNLWTGVATIAGALRRKVWIDMAQFKWVPNFYIILVGPPGIVSKSTTVNVGMSLLREIEDIRFGPQSMTWQALLRDLSESLEHVEVPTRHGNVASPMCCITIPVSEMGTLFKPDDKQLRDVLTDLWDGKDGKWDHSTVSSGRVEVENAWVNIIGCTTPNWITSNFTEEIIGGGFASRILFVYEDKKRRLVAYPGLERATEEHQAFRRRLVADLRKIANLAGEYTLDDSAVAWGRRWYEDHNDLLSSGKIEPRLALYFSRKQTHMHKIALVLAAAQGDSLILTEQHLQDALSLLETTEVHMKKVFSLVGQATDSRDMHLFLEYLRASRKVKVLELYKTFQDRMTADQFNAALQAGFKSGRLDVIQEEHDGKLIKYVVPK